MLLSQANLKVHCAAAQRGRYALNTVAVTRHGTLSTDGMIVLFVPFPSAKPKDAPTIPGVKADAPPPDKTFLLRTEDAGRAAGMVGKAKKGWSTPWTNILQAEIKDGKLVLGATDLSSPQLMTISQADGQFPDVGSVLPDFSKALAITLHIDNTLKALKSLKAASGEETFTLRVIDDQHGISYSTPDGVAVYQMPVGIEKPELHVPNKLDVIKNGPTTATKPEVPVPTDDVPAPGEADTSVGSPQDVEDLPDEDSDAESDDYAYGDEYQDDGPPLESEMEDAAEVLAKAEASQNEAGAAVLGNIAAKLETTPTVPATVQSPVPDMSPAPVAAPAMAVAPEVVPEAASAAPSAPVASAKPATPVETAPAPVEVPAEAVAVGV